MSDSSISNNLNTSIRSASDYSSVTNKNISNGTETGSASKSANTQSQTTISDNADGVSSNKLFQDSDISGLDSKVVSTLKSYGVIINPDNLKLIAAIMKNLPGKVNVGDLLGLLISKKLPVEQAGLVQKYAEGQINLASLFAEIDADTAGELRNAWSSGKLLEKLTALLKSTSELSTGTNDKAKLAEKLVDNFQLQELFSKLPEANSDGNIYFQWPIFWNNQDLPDCLEGEAYIPNGENGGKDSFCLRILINPPKLGQVEIALTTREKELYVHFGVDEDLKDFFKTAFSSIRERILEAGNYTSVQFSISNVRLHKNFFSKEEKRFAPLTYSKIDFKA